MWQLKSNNISEERLLVEESLFSIGNGYIGVRGCFEEAPELTSNSIRGSYINGYYDRVPILYGERANGFPVVQDKQPRIMDTQTVLILLDGEQIVFEPSKIRDYSRMLDMQRGLSKREYRYMTKDGKEASLSFRRMASFEAKNLLCYEIDIQYEGDIEVISLLDSDVSNHSDVDDPRVATGHEKLLSIKALYIENDLLFCEMETMNTEIPLLSLVEQKATSRGGSCDMMHSVEELRITTKALSRGHLKLQKKCIFVDGTRSDDIYQEAVALHNKYSKHEFADLIKIQEVYLNRFWEHSDIQIFGDDKVQEAIRFQLFQLLQSVGKDRASNISAKGLSGEGYEGHYFWDTEIYVLPLFQLTQPQLAKQLLLYRFSILPQAKLRAKELGHRRGAAYPWRTISGIECSSYFPAGTAQYHINADIAYGFIQYHLYHQDMDFMLEAAAEVVFETARIWLEIGHWYKGSYHIDSITGPDEYTAIVNNNLYTNAMAKHHMYWAHKLYHELKEYDGERFEQLCKKIELNMGEVHMMRLASDAMYLPYDDELGIDAQDDSFLRKAVWDFANTSADQYPLLLHFHPLTIYRYQVLKQADTVLAYFLLEDYFDVESMKRSYDYYEKITTHDSSLSSCIYGIMASRCGYNDKALEYFMESVTLDLDNKHGNTKDGLHMANLAGSCLGIINGFAGFRIKESGISLAPIVPKGLKGYQFRIFYLGSWLEVHVGETVRVKLLDGKSIGISIYENKYVLESIIEVERKQA